LTFFDDTCSQAPATGSAACANALLESNGKTKIKADATRRSFMEISR
jgi:hypothetical protein